jgi:hypothetical protein
MIGAPAPAGAGIVEMKIVTSPTPAKRFWPRGENPSIDAIRIELGNTGSKLTIQGPAVKTAKFSHWVCIRLTCMEIMRLELSMLT